MHEYWICIIDSPFAACNASTNFSSGCTSKKWEITALSSSQLSSTPWPWASSSSVSKATGPKFVHSPPGRKTCATVLTYLKIFTVVSMEKAVTTASNLSWHVALQYSCEKLPNLTGGISFTSTSGIGTFRTWSSILNLLQVFSTKGCKVLLPTEAHSFRTNSLPKYMRGFHSHPSPLYPSCCTSNSIRPSFDPRTNTRGISPLLFAVTGTCCLSAPINSSKHSFLSTSPSADHSLTNVCINTWIDFCDGLEASICNPSDSGGLLVWKAWMSWDTPSRNARFCFTASCIFRTCSSAGHTRDALSSSLRLLRFLSTRATSRLECSLYARKASKSADRLLAIPGLGAPRTGGAYTWT
mmetsp:Transcript_32123/g.75429  ORF Transcript_32123/g.75429 Transcript_32123/m.75429 type:complete len:354 (-) Transcript_32123:38-1099(-)